MAAEVLAGLTIETVGWGHADAARLRAEQQREIDLRYAEPGTPSAADSDDAPGPDPRDRVDPSNVFATLLLRVDGEPAGHAAIRDLSGRDDHQGGLHPDGTAEVKRVYVAPAFRGRGLSRALMNAAEDAARAASVRHLILESGLMQPESLGLYLRLGYDPVEPFGVFSDEPGSRCFGKWLAPAPHSGRPPVVELVETPAPGPEIREVPWDDPDAATLRREMWAFLRELYPGLAHDVAARGGHDVVDAENGRAARATFLATLDGRPVGCATLAAAQVGPAHLTVDPLDGVAGLAPLGGDLSGDDPGGFEVRSVFVDPTARRAGVATALVRQVEDAARRRGGLALYLATGVRQPEALRLYVGLGYRPVLPFPPHDDPENAVLLLLGKAL
ncbi:GNAT family N-acetyltransferase [Promicromonospora sp. NPDC057138]|uniref:GNAT family N-acetyltransferase n=1 Tax=Promicromonospora sp. NPDC057138 TaxID=3346031 RepID=UPI00363A0357